MRTSPPGEAAGGLALVFLVIYLQTGRPPPVVGP